MAGYTFQRTEKEKYMENDIVELKNSIVLLTMEIKKLEQGMIGGNKTVYTNGDLLNLLQINISTLRKYRDEGIIGYSKVGNKYFYSSEDVNKFLRQSHYEPFAN